MWEGWLSNRQSVSWVMLMPTEKKRKKKKEKEKEGEAATFNILPLEFCWLERPSQSAAMGKINFLLPDDYWASFGVSVKCHTPAFHQHVCSKVDGCMLDYKHQKEHKFGPSWGIKTGTSNMLAESNLSECYAVFGIQGTSTHSCMYTHTHTHTKEVQNRSIYFTRVQEFHFGWALTSHTQKHSLPPCSQHSFFLRHDQCLRAFPSHISQKLMEEFRGYQMEKEMKKMKDDNLNTAGAATEGGWREGGKKRETFGVSLMLCINIPTAKMSWYVSKKVRKTKPIITKFMRSRNPAFPPGGQCYYFSFLPCNKSTHSIALWLKKKGKFAYLPIARTSYHINVNKVSLTCIFLEKTVNW